RERRGKLVRVDSLDPEPREDLVGASGELAPVDQTRAPLRLVVEEEVLRDGHPRHQRQLLKDGGDPERTRSVRAEELDLRPPDAERARVRPKNAAQELEHRA